MHMKNMQSLMDDHNKAVPGWGVGDQKDYRNGHTQARIFYVIVANPLAVSTGSFLCCFK